MDNFSNVLTQLKKINEESIIDCFVPSANKQVKFKPMTVAQQQQIIKNLANGASDNLKIINSINDIIIANSIDCNDLKIIDREVVLLQYRLHDATIDEQDQTKIKDAIKSIKKESKNIALTHAVAGYGITINCAIPSLQRDSAINAAAVASFESNNVTRVQDMAAALYAYQIIKFINSITVADNTVSFESIEDLPSLMQIIDNLPVDLNNAVLTYANGVQNTFTKALKDKNIALQTPTMQ
jgi:hypothetical protein